MRVIVHVCLLACLLLCVTRLQGITERAHRAIIKCTRGAPDIGVLNPTHAYRHCLTDNFIHTHNQACTTRKATHPPLHASDSPAIIPTHYHSLCLSFARADLIAEQQTCFRHVIKEGFHIAGAKCECVRDCVCACVCACAVFVFVCASPFPAHLSVRWIILFMLGQVGGMGMGNASRR